MDGADAAYDAMAISWVGDAGIGISGTPYRIWKAASLGCEYLCAGAVSAGDNWTSAIRVGSQATYASLLEMIGREELLKAARGDALRHAPGAILARGIVAVTRRILTLKNAVSAAIASEGEGFYGDEVRDLEKEFLFEQKIMRKLEEWTEHNSKMATNAPTINSIPLPKI